jgi:hypothetical protein
MSYYKQNKDIIIQKVLKYYNSHKNNEEWKIKRQIYQHEYYLKHRNKRLEEMKERQKLRKIMKKVTQPKIKNETKIKKKKNLRRVQRHVKSYKNVSTEDTLELEFD